MRSLCASKEQVKHSVRHFLNFIALEVLSETFHPCRPLPATANPSFERTRHGSPLQAFISFWAFRGLLRRASQLTR